MSRFGLSGKVAIVTGGNGGIGRGIAIGFAEAGAEICIAGRDEAKNDSVRLEIEALGRRCIAVKCDVNVAADIDALMAATHDGLGGINILVNNAGITMFNAPEDMTDDEWSSVIETNLSSVFRLSRAAHPALVKAGRGQDYQHRFDVLDLRQSTRPQLLGEQRWRCPAHEVARRRLGTAQHPSERHLAGLDHHRHDSADQGDE